jgi:DNA-directed RNA polymerase specialized sigma24 family protein
MDTNTVPREAPTDDQSLIDRFQADPEGAYVALLERFTPALLRMIRRFMRDPDEVMEVYTSICERLRAHNYQALIRFRTNSELMPWLSVVAANACRDRLRKRRATSVPRSVLAKLNPFELLVFKYYYWQRLPHEDIAEIVNSKHSTPCTAIDVIHAIARINDLLTINKRWLLLVALNANRPALSIDELAENGFHPAAADQGGDLDEALRHREQIERLTDALTRLEAEDQLLVMLRFEHGMTAPQIAEAMHYENHKYVYTRLRTVISRLRRHLVDD